MALVTCTECNENVSTTAHSCPHCGARGNRQSRHEAERQRRIDTEVRQLGEERASIWRNSVNTVPARTKGFVLGVSMGAIGSYLLGTVMNRPMSDLIGLVMMGGLMLGVLFAAITPSLVSAQYRAQAKRLTQISRERDRLDDSRLTLPGVFWGHLVLGGFAANFGLALLAKLVNKPDLIWTVAFATLIYRAWALVHTWKASGRFTGNFTWVVIARFVVIVGSAIAVLELIALFGHVLTAPWPAP